MTKNKKRKFSKNISSEKIEKEYVKIEEKDGRINLAKRKKNKHRKSTSLESN